MAQMDVKGADPEVNLARIRAFAEEAKAGGARVVGCPEMCTTGFDWDAVEALKAHAALHLRTFCGIARDCEIELFGSLLERTERGGAGNSLFYVNAAGEVAGRYRKIHRFSLFGEEKHVEAGSEAVVCPTALGQAGLSICYDLRFPELFRVCVARGARAQLLPSAFPHPRLEHWRILVRARAIENQCFMIAVNQSGAEGGNPRIQYFGHSMAVDPWGEVLFEAGEEEGLFFVDVNPGEVDRVRRKMGALRDRRSDLFGL